MADVTSAATNLVYHDVSMDVMKTTFLYGRRGILYLFIKHAPRLAVAELGSVFIAKIPVARLTIPDRRFVAFGIRQCTCRIRGVGLDRWSQ